MATPTSDQLPINAFAGIFLTVTGFGVLVISRDMITSVLFVGIGLFFLTRALAQYRHGEEGTADGGESESGSDPESDPDSSTKSDSATQ